MPARSFLALIVACLVLAVVMPCVTFAATTDLVESVPNISLARSAGIAGDFSGNLYIAGTAKNQILRVYSSGSFTPTKTVMSVYSSGTSTPTKTVDAVKVSAPVGIATDSRGNVYVADTVNNRVLMLVKDTGKLVTIAGNGNGGFSGDGASALSALLKGPTGVAVDASDPKVFNVYIADNGNYRIRKVAVKFDDKTKNYATDVISTIGGDGKAATLTAYGIAISPAGDLYIADSGNNRVLKMTGAQGTPLVFAGNGTAGFSGDGGLATFAQLNQPSGVVTNGEYLYIADTFNSCVRRVSLTTKVISTRLGAADKFAAITAPGGFTNPVSVAVDTAGTLYVEDTGNKVIQQVFPSISAITTATPPGGSYSTAQSVELKTQKAATIYYTMDGTAPSGASTPYTAPIAISATTTLRFTSIDFSGNQEINNIATYTINTVAPNLSVSPVGVPTPTKPQTVTITSSKQATIYYTIDGKSPTTSSLKYSVPLAIDKTTTLMYFGVDAAGNKSIIGSQTYIIDSELPITTASVISGTYSSIQSVKLETNDQKATIYFTIDGSTPTAASAKYTSPIVISSPTLLQYFAKDTSGNMESVKSQVYTINTLTTTASPKGGLYFNPVTVVLSSNGSKALIYYTTDGTTPSADSKTSKTTQKYSKPLLLQDNKTTLKYFSVDALGIVEETKTEEYVINASTTTAKCVVTANSIELSAKDSSNLLPEILYSTGNSANVTGTPFVYYTSPITFTHNTIVKFFTADSAGKVGPMNTCHTVVAPLDVKPALYLETLPDASIISNASLYVTGNVDPSATLTINGSTAAITSGGSFSLKIPLKTGENTITTVETKGAQSSSDTRKIKYETGAGSQAHDPLIAIGASNGVIGNRVRVPISLKSGFQAATISIEFDTVAFSGTLATPTVEIAQRAAALGKFIQSSTPSEGVYKIVITDIKQPDGATKRALLPDGEIAYLTFSIVSPGSVSKPLTVSKFSASDPDDNIMAVNAPTDGVVNVVSKPGNGWDTAANKEVAAELKDVLNTLNMMLDPGKNPVSGSVDLDGDGRVHIDELQRVINSFIGL